MQNRRQEWLPLLLLFVIWAGAILLVNPLGDFPLNDDFSYGKSVRNLAVDGKFLLDQWLAQTLAAQVLWGAGFCKVFGFSFTVLRFSTLVLGFAGVATSYFLCRELGQGRRLALVFALTIAFNPLFFSLSFTFMTDVPFFAFSILSMLFFIKALRPDSGFRTSYSALFWGAFFALAATFVRQIGLMLPVAFAVSWLCRGGFRWKSFPLAVLPAAVIFAAFIGYNHWLEQGQGLPPGYGNFTRLAATMDDSGILSRVLPRTGILLAYLGAFLLPVSLFLVARRRISSLPESLARPLCPSRREPLRPKLVWLSRFCHLEKTRQRVAGTGLFKMTKAAQPDEFGTQRFPAGRTKGTGLASVAILIFSFAACVFAWEKLPWANQIFNLGLGPKLLKDGQFFINVSPMLPGKIVAGLKLSALASGILLAILIFWKNRDFSQPNRLPLIFALSNLALYLGFLMLDKHFFDRYFLQLMPFLGVCLLAGTGEKVTGGKRPFQEKKNEIFLLLKRSFSTCQLWASTLCLLTMTTFSIAATHDYLAWNRARWQALDFLTQDLKIPPNRIDGGFEFNGWHKPGEREYGRRKSWWWVDRDDFVVAFGDMDGFSKMRGFSFERWLPPGVGNVWVLKKR